MLLKYIEEAEESGLSYLQQLDIYSAKKLLILAEVLKMRDLEKILLLHVIIPKLDRENVIDFLNLAYSKSV